jgi:hypothetical protein
LTDSAAACELGKWLMNAARLLDEINGDWQGSDRIDWFRLENGPSAAVCPAA